MISIKLGNSETVANTADGSTGDVSLCSSYKNTLTSAHEQSLATKSSAVQQQLNLHKQQNKKLIGV